MKHPADVKSSEKVGWTCERKQTGQRNVEEFQSLKGRMPDFG